MTTPSQEEHPSAAELKDRAMGLIENQNTMTLATALKGQSWAAPVYYANLHFTFYFFSDPESRHIREAMDSRQAAAAVFEPASSWRGIRGIQMSGRIQSLSPGLEAVRALRAYLKKYPFTREFFGKDQSLDLTAFLTRFRVKLYRFEPSLLYYMDNSIRFSFRAEIPLS